MGDYKIKPFSELENKVKDFYNFAVYNKYKDSAKEKVVKGLMYILALNGIENIIIYDNELKNNNLKINNYIKIIKGDIYIRFNKDNTYNVFVGEEAKKKHISTHFNDLEDILYFFQQQEDIPQELRDINVIKTINKFNK